MIQTIEIETTNGTLRVTREGATVDGVPVRIKGASPNAENLRRCHILGDGWSAEAPTRSIEIALAILADGKNGDPEAGRNLARLILLGEPPRARMRPGRGKRAGSVEIDV